MRSVLRLAVLVGMLLALGVAPAPAQAAPVLDQFQEDASGPTLVGQNPPGNFQQLAQTFTAGRTGTLDAVDLFLSAVGTSVAPITVEIRTVDAGGAPTNVVLATATIPAASVPPSPGAFFTVTFSAPAAVVTGTRYAIAAYTLDDHFWRRSTSDVYAGGAVFVSFTTPPITWVPSGVRDIDLAFRTFVTVAPYAIAAAVERLAVSGRTLSFRLIGPAKVRFTLDRRIAPRRYRRVGSFVRKARRGRNRVRIPSRVNGKRVTKGVYRLSARSVGGGMPSGPLERRTVRLR